MLQDSLTPQSIYKEYTSVGEGGDEKAYHRKGSTKAVRYFPQLLDCKLPESTMKLTL